MQGAVSVRLSVSRDLWGAAAAIVLASLVATDVVREFRVARAFAPTAAASHGPVEATAVIPADAVSISTLHVDGRTVRVGDAAGAAMSSLSSPAVLRLASEEVGPAGRRQIRAYEVDGASVTVVLEPFEPSGALRVAAIYLH